MRHVRWMGSAHSAHTVDCHTHTYVPVDLLHLALGRDRRHRVKVGRLRTWMGNTSSCKHQSASNQAWSNMGRGKPLRTACVRQRRACGNTGPRTSGVPFQIKILGLPHLIQLDPVLHFQLVLHFLPPLIGPEDENWVNIGLQAPISIQSASNQHP